jgi:hypothetical protein
MDDRVAQLLLAADPSGSPTPSAAAQQKFGRIADALVTGARDVVEFPGRSMDDGLTTGQAADWAAPMAMRMVGSPQVPPGAIGSGLTRALRDGDNAAIEAMRIAARERAERGGGTVRVFDTERALDQSRRPLTPWEQKVAEAKAGFKAARSNAVDDVRAAGPSNPLLADPHWDPFHQPRSLAELFEMASGARDVPGLANGRR